MPFYAWQCLTINLAERSIDFVIKNEKDIFTIISLLIWKTETIDGNAGSASNLTEMMDLNRKQ